MVVLKHSAALAVAVLSLGVWGCSNSGNTSSPTPSPVPGTAVTINVVAVNGSQLFSPNPSTIPAGQKVVWHNVDSLTHPVGMDDRAVETRQPHPRVFRSPMILHATRSHH